MNGERRIEYGDMPLVFFPLVTFSADFADLRVVAFSLGILKVVLD